MTSGTWLDGATDAELLQVIVKVTGQARGYGGTAERLDTVRWVASRGAAGVDWGFAADAAGQTWTGPLSDCHPAGSA